MRPTILIFTDTNNNLLIPAIMQTHQGMREQLSYLDFSQVEIMQRFDFKDLNIQQAGHKTIVRVMIANPDQAAYPKSHYDKYTTPNPDRYAEHFSNRISVEKDPLSSYWIQTFTQQRRRRLLNFVDAPPMKFPVRSVNAYA